jgi:hypothetical protein
MTKYRGKHKGQTRGPYVRAALLRDQNNAKDAFDLSRNLNFFLCNKGYCLGQCFFSDDFCDSYSEHIAYHIAGATISMRLLSYKRKRTPGLPQHYIKLNLSSNDSLDDVIQMITTNFPGFRRIDPDHL